MFSHSFILLKTGGDILVKLKTKKNICFLIFICIFFISVSIVAYIKLDMKLISKTSSQMEETTVKEAISIAYAKVKELSSNAKLIKIISTDAMVKPSEESGSDGTRAVWNVAFTDTKTNAEYNIFVIRGKAEVMEDKNKAPKKGINDSDIKIDSTDALKTAKEQKGLKPGIPNKDWAIGYHFNLEYASYYEIPDKEFLVIEVFGISPKGNFAHVDIDATSGKIIYSGEKTYDENGKGNWTQF